MGLFDNVRAVRNNNPGNIRVGQPWQGLMDPAHMNPAQAAEKEFCVFVTPSMGFRAMAETFNTYVRRDGVKNYADAVKRWAPPNENNTASYLASVCDYCGSSPTDPIPFPNGTMEARATMLKAFSIHEVGGWRFSTQDLYSGVVAAR